MIIVQTNCINQKSHTSLISCPNIIQKYRLVTEKSTVVWTYIFQQKKYAVKIQD